MSLSCYCGDDGDWWYYPPEDYSKMPVFARRKRCCSCKAVIQWNELCGVFNCERNPEGDLEERIYGDSVPLANKWMCEICTDLFFSLTELGFCINLGGENMRDLVKQYAELYGQRK